ncbi:hypothetical protein J3R83DRAFT_2817 [Lanmaoa asiatica]|nr:hypothetical protein J3R83DRAFT_2817 [Lanmaoa asiatica]
MEPRAWTLDQKVVVSILHTFAIIIGIFRSFYRWYISRFWWEDVWVMIALLLDIVCLVCVWMSQSRYYTLLSNFSNAVHVTLWTDAVALTSGLWLVPPPHHHPFHSGLIVTGPPA